MSARTIDYAITTLNTLLKTLENAYWDSSDMKTKDTVFDLYSVINGELTELAKLSINDLDLQFEPITEDFAEACKKFSVLMANLDLWFARSITVKALREALPPAALLVSEDCKI